MPAAPTPRSKVFSVLTDAQVRNALQAAPAGSKLRERLRNELASRLYHGVAKSAACLLRTRYSRMNLTLQEAIDEVTAKVMFRAPAILDSWDPSVANLTTRARMWIVAAISDTLREARTLPLPERQFAQAGHRHKRARCLLERRAQLLRDPSSTDANFEELEKDKAQLDALEQLVAASECLSMTGFVEELHCAAHEPSPEDAILAKVALERLVSGLDAVDRALVYESEAGYSLRELGARHGFSHTRANQRLAKSMERMQSWVEDQRPSVSHVFRRSRPRMDGLL